MLLLATTALSLERAHILPHLQNSKWLFTNIIVYPDYQLVCKTLRLLEDDNNCQQTLEEASFKDSQKTKKHFSRDLNFW